MKLLNTIAEMQSLSGDGSNLPTANWKLGGGF